MDLLHYSVPRTPWFRRTSAKWREIRFTRCTVKREPFHVIHSRNRLRFRWL